MARKKKTAAKKTAKKPAAKKTPDEQDPAEDAVVDDNVAMPEGDKDAVIAEQKAEIAKLRVKVSNKGIPTKEIPNKNKKLLRNADRLALGFVHAMQKKDHKTCSVQELQAVEYQIRKDVKKGGTKMVEKKEVTIKGGFRKNLSDERKERAEGLLEFMGRDPKKPTWDLDINVLGMETM